MQYVALLLVALAASASAFAPAGMSARRRMAREASISDTLESATGPNIYWGSNTQDKPENEIKGTTDYKKFSAAAKAAGVDLSSGEFTVLAPTDLAMEEANKETLTKDEVNLHLIAGKKTTDALKGDQVTVQGKTLAYKRFARQDYLDDAIIGQTPQGPATGQTHPTFDCDNGIIHSIAFVLTADYANSINLGTTTVV